MSHAPLPGLGGSASTPQKQAVAGAVATTVYKLLERIFVTEYAAPGETHGDGAAIIAGAVGGICEFAALSDVSDDKLRKMVLDNFDAIMAQIRMRQAAGGMPGGHA